MEGNAILEDLPGRQAGEVLKATALLYFKDALVKQEYETCAQLAAAAREHGAAQSEINEVIAMYLRGGKAQGAGAKQPVNRLRALT